MKCHDSKTDFKLEVKVHHGEDSCAEYSPHFDRDGSLCCWIPVTAGEDLSIYASLQGPLKECHIDLILDGVLRHSKTISSTKGKSTIRNEKFLAAHQKHGRDITSCKVRVKDLDDTSLGGTAGLGTTFPHTVGTIEVRVALPDSRDVTHHIMHDLGTIEDKTSWKNARLGVVHSQIAPTHEIELVSPEALKPSVRRKMHGLLLKDKERPGTKPWAVFKFFYRSEDAIQGLDLVQNNVYSHSLSALQPSYDDSETETETDPDTGTNGFREGNATLTAPAPANAAESSTKEEAADAEDPVVQSSSCPSPGPRAPSRLEGTSTSQPPVPPSPFNPPSPILPSPPPGHEAPLSLMQNGNDSSPNSTTSPTDPGGGAKPLSDWPTPTAPSKRPDSDSSIPPATPVTPNKRPYSASAVSPTTSATPIKRPHSASPARRSTSAAMSSTPTSSAKRLRRERSETSTQLRHIVEEEAHVRNKSIIRLDEVQEKIENAKAELEAAQKAAESKETLMTSEEKEARLEQKDAELTAAHQRVEIARKEAEEVKMRAEEGGRRREKELEALKSAFSSTDNLRIKAFFAALDRIYAATEVAECEAANVADEHVKALEGLAGVIGEVAKDLEDEMEEAEDIEMFEKY